MITLPASLISAERFGFNMVLMQFGVSRAY
jgi:hypothetical protein